jgi:hypothetical protein
MEHGMFDKKARGSINEEVEKHEIEKIGKGYFK